MTTMTTRTLLVGAAIVGLLTLGTSAQSGNIQQAVDSAYEQFKTLKEGKNADYIPALAKVDPNLFGIAVVTADGKVYTAGDIKTEVSIQSISKVFTMAQVIQEQGLEAIEKRIGVDATGARFNSIIAVEGVRTVVGTGAPEMNPLVNPGAISATSMVRGASSDEVWKKIIGFHNDAAGRQLTVLQDVYKSESDTNQRNQAIGALMLAYGYIKDNWQQAVDLYTRQCSIGVNAKDLATMAATLAAGGTNPVTSRKIRRGDILSLNCFPMVAGYYVALERTLSAENASKEHLKMWETNCHVHDVGKRLLVPGAKCSDIAKSLNDIYAQHDLLKYRTFGYGHSFGVLCHYYGREAGLELREDCDTMLEPGMVVSMEPMIMIPEGQKGAGGYREHDILVISERGNRNITAFPYGPEHLIVKAKEKQARKLR